MRAESKDKDTDLVGGANGRKVMGPKTEEQRSCAKCKCETLTAAKLADSLT